MNDDDIEKLAEGIIDLARSMDLAYRILADILHRLELLEGKIPPPLH